MTKGNESLDTPARELNENANVGEDDGGGFSCFRSPVNIIPSALLGNEKGNGVGEERLLINPLK